MASRGIATAAGGAAVPGCGRRAGATARTSIKGAALLLRRWSRSLTTIGDRDLARCGPTIDVLRRRSRSAEFLVGTKWTPLFEPTGSFGVLPAGRRRPSSSRAIALVVAVPLGPGRRDLPVASTRRPRVRKIIKPVLEMLAGVPTIVFGYFALTFFTPTSCRTSSHLRGRASSTRSPPGIIIGLMIIPTIASLSEDAMSAVPRALREGAFGLGAVQVAVSMRVVFPAALSGIVAAVVLGVSRAVGETMIVLHRRRRPPQLQLRPAARRCRRWRRSSRTPARATSRPARSTTRRSSRSASLLFVMTLAMNASAIRLVRKYRQVYE